MNLLYEAVSFFCRTKKEFNLEIHVKLITQKYEKSNVRLAYKMILAIAITMRDILPAINSNVFIDLSSDSRRIQHRCLVIRSCIKRYVINVFFFTIPISLGKSVEFLFDLVSFIQLK